MIVIDPTEDKIAHLKTYLKEFYVVDTKHQPVIAANILSKNNLLTSWVELKGVVLLHCKVV